jgi:hypothetical protein
MQDIFTLAEAARELGLKSADGLRTQVHRGRLQASLVGKTWVITRDELERYRAQSLGQLGRPGPHGTAFSPVPKATAKVLAPPRATASSPVPRGSARRV